jgi:hypothetical protein
VKVKAKAKAPVKATVKAKVPAKTKTTRLRISLPEMVTVASTLPVPLRLDLYHIDSLHKPDRLPIGCEIVPGQVPGSDKPALKYLPRWYWEAWLEQSENHPAILEGRLYALPYLSRPPLDMLAFEAAVRTATKKIPAPELILRVRDPIGYLASHIDAVATATRPAELREMLCELRASMDQLDTLRQRYARARITLIESLRGTSVYRPAGLLFRTIDDYWIAAPPLLAVVEIAFSGAPKDRGGTKPVVNPFNLTAVQTTATIATELYRRVLGILPSKQQEPVIRLCQAVWETAGGAGAQDWQRPLARAIADQRKGRAEWIRKALATRNI